MIDVEQIIQTVMSVGSFLLGFLPLVAGWLQARKLAVRHMPDIQSEDKAQEIQKKQEFARALVNLSAIEAAYNVARALATILVFHVFVFWAYKLASSMRSKR